MSVIYSHVHILFLQRVIPLLQLRKSLEVTRQWLASCCSVVLFAARHVLLTWMTEWRTVPCSVLFGKGEAVARKGMQLRKEICLHARPCYLHLEPIVAFNSRSKTSISWTSFEQLFTSSVSEAKSRSWHFLYSIALNWGLSCMFSAAYALLPNGNTFIIRPVHRVTPAWEGQTVYCFIWLAFSLKAWHAHNVTALKLLFSSSQSAECASPSLRSANLSALKKRWEQAGNLNQDKPSSVPPPSQPSSRCRPPALARTTSITEHCPPVKSPSLPTAQGGQLTASLVQQPSTAPEASKREEQIGMDRDELTRSERPEKLEQQVPTSPCASYEKPRVPLNNLKMKFEKGEEAMVKVVIDRRTHTKHLSVMNPNT